MNRSWNFRRGVLLAFAVCCITVEVLSDTVADY